ncbi:MG284/MPN403 family protein [Malacoplasma iowae]|uniref:Uncharacterized protein n=1 Tax=Malacoplasma iowae 695 TaxID=1048830 RepID=A0A6P1LLH0_MALIO|nr:hypothetical protein [Malacoplasma iowae]VEU62408.1 Uncharacterised protein [Mycoplasmopsis fermentans]EGZ30896.1 hypothetical protein GUU_04639 [Malacoplasma iowae 695]QHG89773.1 hypothetical protein EER00_02640 [Malacoplasma iowae 695]WPL35426.1 hypothetical protein QX180_03770 [Malacoplasma iowae]VEU72328.1 Uncharacterised protein [Malacoplasma iowae]
MNIYQDFKSKIEKYNIAKFWIENVSKKTDKNDENVNEKYIEWQKYVSLIDDILSQLDYEQRDIIEKIYIAKIGKENMNYSISTFYLKQKRAVQRFLEIYNFGESI